MKWGKEGEPAQVCMAEWATSTDAGPVSPGGAGLFTCGFPRHLQSWAEQLRAEGNVPFDVSGRHKIKAHYNYSYIRHVF